MDTTILDKNIFCNNPELLEVFWSFTVAGGKTMAVSALLTSLDEAEIQSSTALVVPRRHIITLESFLDVLGDVFEVITDRTLVNSIVFDTNSFSEEI